MHRRGFTGIEMVVALAITAIVAATAATALGSSVATFRLATTVRTLAETMRETRARALAEGLPLEVRFDASARIWRVTTSAGTVRRWDPLPASVRFVSLPVRARIRFDATGEAENGTITVGTLAASRRIVVNQRGRVRLG
jgi:prepilin-type N-terminal cleavage/methylation domain-containing protein